MSILALIAAAICWASVSECTGIVERSRLLVAFKHKQIIGLSFHYGAIGQQTPDRYWPAAGGIRRPPF